MREHDRLDLDAVGHDAPAAAERVDVLLAVGRDIEFGPVAQLAIERDSPLLQGIEGHGGSDETTPCPTCRRWGLFPLPGPKFQLDQRLSFGDG
ncbi:MAG: hypothetical protein WDA35_03710, partial [Bacilli bacterium]